MDINDVLHTLNTIPPDIQTLDCLLSENDFAREDLSILANEAVGKCFCEFRDAAILKGYELNPEFQSLHIDDLFSNSLMQILECLLKHGYDPNYVVDKSKSPWDAFENLMFVDAPNIGASCLRLLLEHGANPNRQLPSEPESLFEDIAFMVSYDSYTHYYMNIVQCWLVLMAFGACWRDGSVPLSMLNGHDISIFKEFEKYDFSIEDLPQVPGKYGCWKMHLYDIRTNEEVAVYE